MPPDAGKVPLRARAPWFWVWVPLALLLYVLINGAGHMASFYWVTQTDGEVLHLLKPAVPFLWGSWAFLTLPALAALAWASWRLCPQASPAWRSFDLGLGLLFFGLFLAVQGALIQAPFGWPLTPANRSLQGRILVHIWRPHGSLPGLEASSRDLAGFLTDPDPLARGNAAWLLACRGEEGSAPGIVRLLTDPDSSVRIMGIGALSNLGAERFAPEIAKLLKDPAAKVRLAAVSVLCGVNAKAYSQDLAELLRDPDPSVRVEAVEELRDIGADDYVLEIAKLLDDPERRVRSAAAMAVLPRGVTKSFETEVTEMLANSNTDVRRIAVSALGMLRATKFTREITQRLTDPDEGVRQAAAEALERIKRP